MAYIDALPMLQFPRTPEAIRIYSERSFTTVSSSYDWMKALISGGNERRWKKRLLRRFVTGSPRRRLDLASGTGDFIRMLNAGGPPERIVAFDLNWSMLLRSRAAFADGNVAWARGDLNFVPFRDASFDLITMGYGWRYAYDLERLAGACFRLLAPGGMFFAFDVGRPRSRVLDALWQAYLFVAGSLIGLLFHFKIGAYWHLVESLRAFPGQDRVGEALRASGFTNVQCVEIMGGTMIGHFARK